jgi:hypothetical protein
MNGERLVQAQDDIVLALEVMRQVHKLELQWTSLLSIVCTNNHFLLKRSLKAISDNHSSVADCFLFSFGSQETEAIRSFFVPHAHLDIDDHYN